MLVCERNIDDAYTFYAHAYQFSNIMRKGRSVNVGLCFLEVAQVLLFESCDVIIFVIIMCGTSAVMQQW
jgi:hypothetical protein